LFARYSAFSTFANQMVNQIFYAANSQGVANHGWLKSYDTFSFASYHHLEHIYFGALHVLNDDEVNVEMGFGSHAHDKMEIISMPLEDDLQHKDSMGNVTIIKNSHIQIISAGSGITHSEYNKNKDSKVKFLQIWMIPNQRNISPQYDQITLDENDRHYNLQQILSPNANDEGIWIYQNVWFHLAKVNKDFSSEYKLKSKGNGLYVFNLKGDIIVNEQAMSTRDGFGILGY
jgi:quercetin 2,3-dioxygenase